MLPAQHPQSGLPFRAGQAGSALERQHHAHWVVESAFEDAAEPFALQGIVQAVVQRIDIHRKPPFLLQMIKRIFEGLADVAGIETQAARQCGREKLGLLMGGSGLEQKEAAHAAGA